MKPNYTRTFDQIHMPEAKAREIRATLLSRNPKSKEEKNTMTRRNYMRRPAAVLTAVILILSVTALAYGTKIVENVHSFFSGGTVEQGTDEQGNAYSSVSIDTDGSIAPMDLRGDGRMYLTVNGEDLDITEQFSYSEPYIYEFTDADGLRHVIVIGGELDAAGWAEFMWDKEGVFSGGQSHFGTPNGSDDAPWLTVAGEKLNLPWVF